MADESTIILDDVKRLLNIGTDVTEFDSDIQSHTNGAFFTLFQLGIGPQTAPFYIDNSTTWDEFETTVPYDVVVDYIHLKVALVFDPPSSSGVLEAYKDRISELEFRMNIYIDDGGGNVTG